MNKPASIWSALIGTACLLSGLAPAAFGTPSVTIHPREQTPVRAFIGVSPIALELEMVVPEGTEPRKATATAVLSSADGKAVDTDRIEMGAVGPGKYPLPFALMPADYGYYSATVTVTAGDGQTLGAYSTGYAILQPLSDRQRYQDPRKSIFGVNFHYDQGQGDLEVTPHLMNMAGVRWIRDTIDWASVEKIRGEYAMKPYLSAAFPLALRRYGIRTLGVLCYGNPLYPHGTPEEVEAYGRYAEFVARDLGASVEHFEIWNEPNGFTQLSPEQYALILQAGSQGVRKGNPRSFVIGLGGASPGGWSAQYVPAILNAGAAASMDTFSIHPYTSPSTCDVGYRTEGASWPLANLEAAGPLTAGLPEEIRKARNMKDVPAIWITEMGWPSSDVGLMGQAQQVARAYTMVAALPNLYSRLFLYDFLCDGSDAREKEHNFGIVGHDYSVRPGYVALATVSRALEGRPFLRRVPCQDETVRLYLFGPEDDALLVAWVTEVGPSEVIAGKLKSGKPLRGLNEAGSWVNRSLRIDLKVAAKETSLHDWQDRVTQGVVKDGSLTLNLSTSPTYVYHIGDAKRVSIDEEHGTPGLMRSGSR